MRETKEHEAVMVSEVINNLVLDPGGKYLDCTFGLGGHTKAILSKLFSFRILVTAAVSAVGIVVNNEIPCAIICSNPPKKINIGILMIPPPIPKRPDPIPETKPIRKYKIILSS